jgi:hypothetical protein
MRVITCAEHIQRQVGQSACRVETSTLVTHTLCMRSLAWLVGTGHCWSLVGSFSAPRWQAHPGFDLSPAEPRFTAVVSCGLLFECRLSATHSLSSHEQHGRVKLTEESAFRLINVVPAT